MENWKIFNCGQATEDRNRWILSLHHIINKADLTFIFS